MFVQCCAHALHPPGYLAHPRNLPATRALPTIVPLAASFSHDFLSPAACVPPPSHPSPTCRAGLRAQLEWCLGSNAGSNACSPSLVSPMFACPCACPSEVSQLAEFILPTAYRVPLSSSPSPGGRGASSRFYDAVIMATRSAGKSPSAGAPGPTRIDVGSPGGGLHTPEDSLLVSLATTSESGGLSPPCGRHQVHPLGGPPTSPSKATLQAHPAPDCQSPEDGPGPTVS